MLLLSFYLIFFHENYFYFLMFRDVPACSGSYLFMFRHRYLNRRPQNSARMTCQTVKKHVIS